MKKTLLLILIFTISKAFSQNAYNDALLLTKFTKGGKFTTNQDSIKTYIAILNNYLINPLPQTSLKTIANEFRKKESDNYNPFLKDLFIPDSLGMASASQNIGAKISSVVNAVGGLDVTNIANGVAMLMIDHAKQELTVAFFERFKKFAKNNPEFQVLFPKTTDNLGNLLSYKYPEMLPALRTGFFEDLNSITYHLDDILELPRYRELLKHFPEIRIIIRSIRLVHELESGYSNPAEVIEKFASFQEWAEPDNTTELKNLGNSLKLAAIFSGSLRNCDSLSGDSTRIWITLKDVKKMVTDTVQFKLYLGLFDQLLKKKNIQFIDNNKILKADSILEAQKNNVFLVENKIIEFIELTTKVDKVKEDLQYKIKNHISFTNDDSYSYINTSIDVIDYGMSVIQLFVPYYKGTDFTKIVRKSNELYRHIYKKEYTQAISNAMDVLKGITSLADASKNTLIAKINADTPIVAKSFNKLKIKDTTAIKQKFPNDTITLIKTITLLNTNDDLSKFSDFIARVTEYGLFMANVVNADTPEEVQAALENVILPVGSSSIKKNSCFNISIQSYLGAYGRIGSLKENTNSAWNDRYGLTAPIGISFSKGLGNWGAASLFFSLFDIGAIVDYQLKKDSIVNSTGSTEEVVEKKYKVELGQILSPGAYVVYGFGANLPLSIGFGAQYGPGLSKIDAGNNVTVGSPQLRWSVFLGVDLPFFNLKNKAKDYKK